VSKRKSSEKVATTNPLKILLERFFRDATSKNELLWPDEAMRKLFDYINKIIEIGVLNKDKPTATRVNEINFNKELHHYAVDLFYKTYFPTKKGAPPIPDEYYEFILKLHNEGKTHKEIAEEVDLPISTKKVGTRKEVDKSKDVIRKQIDKAKKRNNQKSENG
jgi:hypothetical protein